MIHISSWSSSKTHFSITAMVDDKSEILPLRSLIVPLIRQSFRLKFGTPEGKIDECRELNLWGKSELISLPENEFFTIIYDHPNASFHLQKTSETIDDKYVEELLN